MGGHGKRIGNWQGERIILVCTECHNSHSPSIKPKQPDPPPLRHAKVPAWLLMVSGDKKSKTRRTTTLWETLEEELKLGHKE